jgi:hypothetical protein
MPFRVVIPVDSGVSMLRRAGCPGFNLFKESQMKTDNTVTEREFQDLRERILQQLAPATALQHFWAENMVYCYWRYELARRLECRVIALGPSSTEEPQG